MKWGARVSNCNSEGAFGNTDCAMSAVRPKGRGALVLSVRANVLLNDSSGHAVTRVLWHRGGAPPPAARVLVRAPWGWGFFTVPGRRACLYGGLLSTAEDESILLRLR